MRKTFYQFHIQAIYIRFVCAFFVLCGLYVITAGIEKSSWITALIGIIPMPISWNAYYKVFHNRMIFTPDRINITGEKGKVSERIQFEETIAYNDIENIRLICANLNSRKEHIGSSNLGNLNPSVFFEFILKSQETKWVCVSLFSKKQRKEMLEIINSKTGKSFSYDALEEEDLSIYSKMKSKKR